MKHAMTCPHCSARLSLDLELRTAREAGRTLTVQAIARARERVSAGESVAAVARQLGVAPSTLARALRGRTWRGVVGPIELPDRRVTEAERVAILSLRAEGRSLRVIARALDRPLSTVRGVLERERAPRRRAA